MHRFSRAILAVGVCLLPTGAVCAELDSSIIPAPRPEAMARDAVADAEIVISTSTGPMDLSFHAWIETFRTRALAEGVDAAVYDTAMARVTFNPKMIERDRGQPEFSKRIWDYLDTAASELRISLGRAALDQHAALLDEIEARYGVEKEVVAAVWGMESNYGSHRGGENIIAAMASLAFDGRRPALFEAQLIAALKIVQAGDADLDTLRGSWAGAMGHTQFMPTSYLDFAVDHDGDGRRDIWSNDPTDALASTAAYLERHGWTTGQPWAVEVTLPEGFDFTQAGKHVEKPAPDWSALGVQDVTGAALPDSGAVSILLPAGHAGPAFAIYGNFRVLERYNAADAYVMGVGHLSDRLAGGAPIQAAWPRGDRPLSLSERREMQERLVSAGFDPNGVDGIFGPGTRAAVRAFQQSAGLVPDGYASAAVLDRLRAFRGF